MVTVLRGILFLFIGLAIAVAALWVVGPYEEVDTEIAFDPGALPEDLDGWLADTESQVPNLRPGSAKRIIWAGAPGQRTDLAIVYLHGFSANLWEIRPVADRAAAALGANLFYQRLAGHGRDGAAMAEPRAGDWLEDVAEAMAIGRRLGDRVVVVGTSTGGLLAAILAADRALAAEREGLAGVALVSPNFRVAGPAAQLLSWPAARYWVPVLAGEQRGFEPINAAQAEHWTTRYPTVAALPMQALVDHAEDLDWGAARMPALFYFSPRDQVVMPAATEAVAAAWGGAVTVERVPPSPGDDPSEHVIAGEIVSPGRTPDAIATLTAWLQGL
ncbi:alpha/beta hydrolase [Jannaschia seohaensis]|uniref:Serine aminopeptidase S33 family n=1 Tax=Jannaschia seohaensis TaxID=475081 RepID=A0A2Y9AAH3_9RHOB|nr:alpha/beta fold hydrolase [Jannaschia seohaensis]PWJ20870.1 serine aminopeptidase S33 family [Jannaschia seohaensis]SSA41280.1 Serine aminopeptidase, S33 [Jannaschia seohaensis]